MKRIASALVFFGTFGLVVALIVRARRPVETTITRADETAHVANHYDRMSGSYDPGMRFFDWLFAGAGRRWACSQATGDVLEIAIGTGRNLPYYRTGVRLSAIDISPAMLEIARQRASDLSIDVDLRPGDAQALDFPDASFDTVVSTLSMCTIPNERQAIREARRVLRPGGAFVLFEHVGSPNPVVRSIQQALDPLSVRLAADHLLREPVAILQDEGFVIDHVERGRLGVIERISARRAD
jgi:ubiquinone/menaquinone biosynthesis C-methylase UbiE